MRIEMIMVGEFCPSTEFKVYEQNIEKNDNVYKRIINNSFVENDNIKLEDLVYLNFLYYNYKGKSTVGEIIINKKIKDKFINIMKEAFDNKIEFNSFKLVDDYFETEEDDRNKIDNRSIADNNSYAFFYRKIYGTDKLSNHSFGCAVDINPKENPYLPYRNGKYDYSNLSSEDIKYLTNRENIDNPHVITHKSLIYKLFKKNDFIWGGDWEHTKDYQHFEANNE